MKIFPFFLRVSLLLTCVTAYADDSFVLKKITVEGLAGADANHVLRYLPIKIGQNITPQDTTNIINHLYQTQFFSDIHLTRQGNTLIVSVKERAVINTIKIDGSSVINQDQLKSALKEMQLVRGEVFSQAAVDALVKNLQSAYAEQGFYNARLTTTVTTVGKHRVNVRIHVSEGRVALIKKIHIIGNHDFSEKQLLAQLPLTPPRWDTLITKTDHYSQPKFQQALEKLSDYYLDRGYLKFKVTSANAVLNPDRQSLVLIINVTEGSQYRLSTVNFSGNTILPLQQFTNTAALKDLKKNSIFSRQKIMRAADTIKNLLQDKGYAFAEVNILPKIDEGHKTVAIIFQIEPSNKVYVRRINFKGNISTADNVLRSAVPQAEGGLYSGSAIHDSIRQLNLLGYFEKVHEKTEPVTGSTNQVDLNYSVNEQPSAQASVGAGYSTDGAVFNATINEANFLGTGKQVGVSFDKSQYQRSYSFNYNNPYYTPSGVQRGFSFYNTHTSPSALNLSDYTLNNYGANIYYSVPFSAKDAYQFGIGAQRTSLGEGAQLSQQIAEFFKDQGAHFNQTLLTGGWSRNTLDRSLFPRDGLLQNLGIEVSAPLSGKALDYYKFSYQAQGFHPIAYGFIGGVSTALGYGHGYGNTPGLPFFVNYYAGGLGVNGQVRGYETNTLGPIDSAGNPLGGNVLTAASMELILPHPISRDSVRTSLFVDAGTVYTTWNMYHTYAANQLGVHLNKLHYSTGLDVQWRVPILNGILEFSLAKPIGKTANVHKQYFSFNIGTSI